MNIYKDMGRTKIRLDIPSLTPGMKFRHDGGVYHVVDVIDDNGKIIIVTKYFGIHTRWWHYKVYAASEFESLVYHGLIKKYRS